MASKTTRKTSARKSNVARPKSKSALNAKFTFSRSQLAIVIGLIFVIGGIIVWRVLAATSQTEVETWTASGGNTKTVADNTASGGSYLEFLTPTVTTTVTPTPTPTLSIPTGYSQIFLDNFDGTSLNTLVWKPYNNNYGSGNKEEECNTPNNVTISNGSLLITAKRENIVCPGTSTNYSFTSAFLGTRENNTYFPKFARYEMRAKLPHAQGLWPAFWLRHRNGSTNPLGAEVDVMEYFHSQVPGKTSSTLHLDGTSNVAKKTVAFETPTTTPGWHTWAVETKPDVIDTSKVNFSFALDGTEFYNITPSQKAWATDATNGVDPNHMFDIAINMAVGGNYVGHPDDELGWSRYLNKCLKPYGGAAPCDGTGILRASFPSTYEVDYVRVLTKN